MSQNREWRSKRWEDQLFGWSWEGRSIGGFERFLEFCSLGVTNSNDTNLMAVLHWWPCDPIPPPLQCFWESLVLMNECAPAWFLHALPIGLLTPGCCSVTWARPSSQCPSLLTIQSIVPGSIFPYNFLKELKQGSEGGNGLGSPRMLLSSHAVVSLSLFWLFPRNACSDT